MASQCGSNSSVLCFGEVRIGVRVYSSSMSIRESLATPFNRYSTSSDDDCNKPSAWAISPTVLRASTIRQVVLTDIQANVSVYYLLAQKLPPFPRSLHQVISRFLYVHSCICRHVPSSRGCHVTTPRKMADHDLDQLLDEVEQTFTQGNDASKRERVIRKQHHVAPRGP